MNFDDVNDDVNYEIQLTYKPSVIPYLCKNSSYIRVSGQKTTVWLSSKILTAVSNVIGEWKLSIAIN